MTKYKFAIGERVRIGKIEGENFGGSYGNPEGLEGVITGYDMYNHTTPWEVAVSEEPDGTPDAYHYYYPELYKESELTSASLDN